MKKRREKTPKDYYDNRLKPPKAFFEWCYSNMRTYVWENKKNKIVSSHRKHQEVIKKRLAKNSCLTFFDQSEYFEIVLCTKKRIERQTYRVFSSFEKGKQHFDCQLVNLHMFRENQYQTVHRINAERYDWGKMPIIQGMYRYSPTVYDNNIIKRLEKQSELKYLDLKDLTVDTLYFYYKYRKQLEYIQKIKAFGLEKQVISGQFDFRSLTMNFLKKWKPFIKNSYLTMNDIKLKIEIENRGGKYIKGIERILTASQVRMLDTQIPIMKLQNYLLKQDQFSIFRYYNDYLTMLKELNIPYTNSNLFPKNLTIAHDKAVDTLNEIKLEVENKAFEKRYKKIQSLEMTVKGMAFILPKKASDLVKEGRELNHCVGMAHYITKHAEEKSTIVFIRKETDPTQPYYTLELSNNKLVQCFGYKNERPSEELTLVVQEWLSIVTTFNRKEKKIA